MSDGTEYTSLLGWVPAAVTRLRAADAALEAAQMASMEAFKQFATMAERVCMPGDVSPEEMEAAKNASCAADKVMQDAMTAVVEAERGLLLAARMPR